MKGGGKSNWSYKEAWLGNKRDIMHGPRAVMRPMISGIVENRRNKLWTRALFDSKGISWLMAVHVARELNME